MEDTLKVPFTLVGQDGNAFALLGGFSHAAKKAGYSASEIDAVLKEARSGDYDHLLHTLILNCVDEDED